MKDSRDFPKSVYAADGFMGAVYLIVCVLTYSYLGQYVVLCMCVGVCACVCACVHECV